MSPRVAKKDKPDLPKPVIQTGMLGFHPLKPLPVSYLFQQHCDIVLGHKDAEPTLKLKDKPVLKLQDKTAGAKIETFDLSGKFFNGLSDAFYRGKLPQVIVSVMDLHYLNDFLNEFLDYLDKILSLGFFVQKPNPVDTHIPFIVLAGNGIFYNNFMAKLIKNLRHLEGLDTRLIHQIVSRFVRGNLEYYPEEDENTAANEASDEASPGRIIPLEARRMMKIGSKVPESLTTIQTVLSLHGLITAIDNTTDNPPERLELINTWLRLRDVILPRLKQASALSAKEEADSLTLLKNVLLTIGKSKKAFDELETIEMLFPFKSENAKGNREIMMGYGDYSFLPALMQYAEQLNLQEEKKHCAMLAFKIKQLLPIDFNVRLTL